MTFSKNARFRFIVVAALLAPGALVQGFRFLSGASLSAVSAAITPATAPVLVPPTPAAELTPEQKRAIEWLALRRGESVVRSPMDHPTVAVEPEPEPEVTPEVIEKPDPFAGLVVTSIMIGGDQQPMAVINGRVQRVGDVIRGAWTISEIDRIECLVRFTNTEGETATLTMKRPELHK